jgi:hypothetical protein
MNDVPSLARQARANLAQALSALQEDNVPPQTQALASVVADAMNLLHRIEKNYAAPNFDRRDHSSRALLLVRNALNSLQAPENSHPSTERVLEPAAHAVGLVHQLHHLAGVDGAGTSERGAPAPSNPPAVAKVVTPPPSRAQPTPSKDSVEVPPVSAPRALVDEPQPTAAPAAEPGPTTAPAERGSLAPAQERISTNPDRISTNPIALAALDPMPGEVYIEVALGAYSASNFYRPSRDKDIVEGGGLFVATYAPPELAQSIRIRASLTGGFEFEGRGTVDWRREMPKSGSLNPLTPPGFGLKFTELSDDARKMVARYSRSREPFVREADASTPPQAEAL